MAREKVKVKRASGYPASVQDLHLHPNKIPFRIRKLE